MVYSRRQFRPLLLPSGCGNSGYPHVPPLLTLNKRKNRKLTSSCHSLSWADTAASTIGRLFGSSTPKLPSRLPFLPLPMAPRKSLAGFLAASITGASIAFGFWGWIATMRNGGRDVTWSWNGGVRRLPHPDSPAVAMGAGGPFGLLLISVVAGVVSGVAEALGALLFFVQSFFFLRRGSNQCLLDLGSIDDNLSLPIISGCCILGFIKALGLVATSFSASSWFS